MRMGARRERVQRLRRSFLELPQHEQLRTAHSNMFFRPARRLSEALDDPPDAVEHRTDVGVTARRMGSHTVIVARTRQVAQPQPAGTEIEGNLFEGSLFEGSLFERTVYEGTL
jgi:hypothetical protein